MITGLKKQKNLVISKIFIQNLPEININFKS